MNESIWSNDLLVGTVKRIMARKTDHIEANQEVQDQRLLYLVEWAGAPSALTWEPPEHLAKCESLIKEFEEAQGRTREMQDLHRREKSLIAAERKLKRRNQKLMRKGCLERGHEVNAILELKKDQVQDELMYRVSWYPARKDA